MARHGLVVWALLFAAVQPDYADGKETRISIVLKPRNWTDPRKIDGFLCGLDTTLDPDHLIAELNTDFVFNYLDKTKDKTPGYRTAVFDVTVFNKNEQPINMLDNPACPLSDEHGLYSLFIAPGMRQCNSQTFEDAKEDGDGYYPIAVGTSNVFNKSIEWFISKASTLRTLYGEKLPKLCGTKLAMKNETAHNRKNELEFLFSFVNQNGQVREFQATKWKVCEKKEHTLATIHSTDIFESAATVKFKHENQTVPETDGYARIELIRSSPVTKKAVTFVKTVPLNAGDKCAPASEDDFVPLSNAVIFHENKVEGEVFLRIKQDDIEEDVECVRVEEAPWKNVTRVKRGFGGLGKGGTGQRIALGPGHYQIENPHIFNPTHYWNGYNGPVTDIWHAVLTGGDPGNLGHAQNHIQTCIDAHNALPFGTPGAHPIGGHWTGPAGPRPLPCQIANCPRNARHGAHVYTVYDTPNQDPNRCWLLATCAQHNRPPHQNEFNYPLHADYLMWQNGPGYTGPGYNVLVNPQGLGLGLRTWANNAAMGPDFYGHNTINPAPVVVGNLLPIAQTIRDIKDGMDIRPTAVLVPHHINVDQFNIGHQEAGAYAFP